MGFIARQNEVKFIRNVLSNNDFPGLLIYGRKGVGKTRLIAQSFKGLNFTPVIFQCIRTNDEENVSFLNDLIRIVFSQSELSLSSLDDIFDFLLMKAQSNDIVLVLDEFQNWLSSSDGIESSLRNCLEKCKNSRLKVIISDSDVCDVERKLKKQDSLFASIQQSLRVEPFDYYDAAAICGFVEEDAVKLYSCFGGLPYVLSCYDPKESFKDNIYQCYLSDRAPVSSFIESVLREEVNQTQYANLILLAIAKGNHKYSEIFSFSKIQSNMSMDRAMDSLLSLGIVKREAPINDEKSKKKNYYSISDNAIAFYFKYIFANRTYLNLMSKADFYETFIKPDLKINFIPERFKIIFRQFLIRKNTMKPTFEKIGRYCLPDSNEKNGIDLDCVSCSGDKYTCYETYYKKDVLSEEDLAEIKEKLHSVNSSDSFSLSVCSKEGYEGKYYPSKGFYTLSDLFYLN